MPPRVSPRIVSLAPSVTQTLYALGATHHLVAVTRWCKDVVPSEAISSLPALEDCWSLDPTQLRPLNPDLVIGSVPYQVEFISGILAEGMRFLAQSPRTLCDIHEDIRLLGGIVEKPGDAERVIISMRDRIASVRKRAGMLSRPRVYCEAWPNPPRSAEHWTAEMVEAAGGKFIPWPPGRPVAMEEIVRADPEIIVLVWTATGDRSRPESVYQRPGWEQIDAVRNRRVVVIPDQLLNTPAPILVEGLDALARAIHPELNADSLQR